MFVFIDYTGWKADDWEERASDVESFVLYAYLFFLVVTGSRLILRTSSLLLFYRCVSQNSCIIQFVNDLRTMNQVFPLASSVLY